jgi:hypothetical protein
MKLPLSLVKSSRSFAVQKKMAQKCAVDEAKNGGCGAAEQKRG